MNARESFQKGPFGKQWMAFINSEQWEAAKNAALLHHQSAYPFPQDGATAIAQRYEMTGALRFVKILETLTSVAPPAPKSSSGNLDSV